MNVNKHFFGQGHFHIRTQICICTQIKDTASNFMLSCHGITLYTCIAISDVSDASVSRDVMGCGLIWRDVMAIVYMYNAL